MNCSTCLQTKPIPMCVSAIIIGQISAINTDVVVKLKNESTQRIDTINATSDNDGVVTVDVSGIEFMENHYTVSVHPAADYSNDYDIAINGESSKCVDMGFEHCHELINEVELEIVE